MEFVVFLVACVATIAFVIICAVLANIIFEKIGDAAGKKVMNISLKSVLSESDFEKEKQYFREIINNYNAAIISYIDDFKMDYQRDEALVLLNLKLKGFIEFDKGKEEIITNESKKDEVDGLSLCEKIVYNGIKNGKLNLIHWSTFRETVEKDAKNQELILPNKKRNAVIDDEKDKKFGTFIQIFLVCFLLLLGLLSLKNVNDTIREILNISLTTLTCAFYIIIFFSIIFYRGKSYVGNLKYARTEKGEEINKKIDGLRNFLKEYSLMSERELNEINLWDEYLIYSILFDQNEKAKEELYKYVIYDNI